MRTYKRLESIEVFEGCSRQELAAIDRLFTEVMLPAGTRLITAGRFGQEFFVVRDGDVVVARAGEELARLGDGGVVGELALLDDQPRTADVCAVSDVNVLVQNRREFATLLALHPKVAERVRAIADERRAA